MILLTILQSTPLTASFTQGRLLCEMDFEKRLPRYARNDDEGWIWNALRLPRYARNDGEGD